MTPSDRWDGEGRPGEERLDHHGAAVEGLLSTARDEAVIIAPFITYQAIARLLDACPDGVPLTVAGRFLPSDVAAGACDLAAAELLMDHHKVVAFSTNPVLHGKLFRADTRCLIGSANVTNRGLGWSVSSNLELLVSSDRNDVIERFERLVWAGSVSMTRTRLLELRARARDLATTFERGAHEASVGPESGRNWLPTCRNPRVLYNAYSSVDEWKILDSVLDAARWDLSALAPFPQNLDRSAFERVIAHALSEHPVVSWLRESGGADSATAEAKLREFLSPPPKNDLPLEMLWEVLQEWLLYFFSDEIRTVPTETRLVVQKRL